MEEIKTTTIPAKRSEVAISSFNALAGSSYEVQDCDTGHRMIFTCTKSGPVTVKYRRIGRMLAYILKGEGELLFADRKE